MRSSLTYLPCRSCLLFFLLGAVAVFLCFVSPDMVHAAEDTVSPQLQLTLSGGGTEPDKVSLTLEILFFLTILSLAPAIVMTVTSFTRIIIVFHFLRQAMGIQQVPPNQVLASLAIFMTIAIMMPIGKEMNATAFQPYLREEISLMEGIERAEKPLRSFMFTHTHEKDLSIFYTILQMDRPTTKDDVPTISLAAAFILSELKTAFTIGFLI